MTLRNGSGSVRSDPLSLLFMLAAVVSIVVYAYGGERGWAVAALAAVLLYAAARGER